MDRLAPDDVVRLELVADHAVDPEVRDTHFQLDLRRSARPFGEIHRPGTVQRKALPDRHRTVRLVREEPDVDIALSAVDPPQVALDAVVHELPALQQGLASCGGFSNAATRSFSACGVQPVRAPRPVVAPSTVMSKTLPNNDLRRSEVFPTDLLKLLIIFILLITHF